MRAPEFWWHKKPHLFARLLQPIGSLYGAITAMRMARTGQSATRPIICVGNFIAGGAGKTPTAIALAERLHALNHTPAFLTRGYGGQMRGPVLLPYNEKPEGGLTHQDVGDEPLLLSRYAPVMVARNRLAGLKALLNNEATTHTDVVIMDDGLQNPSIYKTLSFAVVDGQSGIGNGLCIPAGPMRAPLVKQWPYVDAVIVIGSGDAGVEIANAARAQGKRVFTAHIEPDPNVVRHLRGRRILAFAGIGRPEKFFKMLEKMGAEIVYSKSFPDHAPFSSGEIAALEYEALQKDLLPVTTEKDAIRLLTVSVAPQLRASMAVVPIRLVFDEETQLRDYLLESLEKPLIR